MATGGAVSFFDPWPHTGGLKDLALLKLWLSSQLGSNLIPGPGAPYASGCPSQIYIDIHMRSYGGSEVISY